MRIEDRFPYLRGSRSVVMRTAIVEAVLPGGTGVDLSMPGGSTLTGVPVLASVAPVVGDTVLVLYDQDRAFAIGTIVPYV